MLCPRVARAELYSYVDDDGRHPFHQRPRQRPTPTGQPYQGRDRGGLRRSKAARGHRAPRREACGLRGQRRPASTRSFEKAAKHYRLPFALLKAVAKVESNFDPQRRLSRQRQRADAADRQTPRRDDEGRGPLRPRAEHLRGGSVPPRPSPTEFDGNMDLVRTTAAYNAGPERVRRAGGVPEHPRDAALRAARAGDVPALPAPRLRASLPANEPASPTPERAGAEAYRT